jgi:methionine-rich copper-binding protein CopC
MKKVLLAVSMLCNSALAVADQVAIDFARFTQRDASWKVDVTLKHADSGWDHYANEWRIVDDKGTVLDRRVLAHPHVDEQPFTRSLYSAKIPQQVSIVFIEASDSVHGWSPDRIRVDLSKSSGERYQVQQSDAQ